jgi:hypothetical protein
MISVLPNITDSEQENLDTMIEEYVDDFVNKKRLILIAHSQGNMYANRSVRILRNTFPNYANKYLKMIGVASPSAVTDDPYITACDDRVIDGLRLSPYYSVLDCNINNIPHGEDFREYWHHEFILSYLDERLLSRGLIDFNLLTLVKQWEHPQNQ